MEKKGWGDVSTLAGLEMDWDYCPDCRDGKRLHKRISQQDVLHLFGSAQIEVKMASANATFDATLRDLSEGGMGVKLGNRLDEFQNLKVGLVLGQEKIIASAQVRHVRYANNGYTAGLQFINLEPSIRKFIASMYTSKVLRHGF
ncbi:MAG: PilZ domain-containing protein [Desulfobulbus sp.]|nr:PilZ domain-containing protein [Desulfobulbus sp.]